MQIIKQSSLETNRRLRAAEARPISLALAKIGTVPDRGVASEEALTNLSEPKS
jgi:hypothetical protein